MALYDPNQSLSANLVSAGFSPEQGTTSHGSLSPEFIASIQTAMARAGLADYGGQQAFDLISRADPNRVRADPFGYANELLGQSGIQGFSSGQDFAAANTALPGHNEQSTPFNPLEVIQGGVDAAKSYASNQGSLLPLALAGGVAAFGPGAATATPGAAGTAGGTGLLPTAGGVTGLTPGAAGATGLAATPAAGTALAPGFFAAEGIAPAAAGALVPPPSGGGSNLASTGGAGTGISLSQIAAGAIPAALGVVGANRQANAFGGLANQYMAMGAPYRSRLSELYSDPEDWLNSAEVQIPVQQGTNILARSLSTKGNPMGSGNALQELQNYASKQLFDRLGQEKDRLAGFGGLSAYNQAAPGAAGAEINAQKGIYDAIGAGAADIFNPPRRITLQDLMRL